MFVYVCICLYMFDYVCICVYLRYYVCGGRVTAVATMGADPVAVAASELLRQGKMPSVASVKRSSELLYLAGLVKPI
jgi:hypothetical protein